MPRTGQKNDTAGIYKPSCGDKEIAHNKGVTFPPCPDCNREVNWTLVRATQ